MIFYFTQNGWEDYFYWQQVDKKMVKKINSLIKDIKRTPFAGIGKPEGLKHDLVDFWTRRMDLENRLLHEVKANEITIISCHFHNDNN